MHMAPGKISFPSVFVVDSPTRPPPLPPKPGYRQRQNKIQMLLVILVIVALCGMTLEACFIYRLYSTKEQPNPTNEPQFSMIKKEKEEKHKQLGEMKPSKPMAQLTTGNSTVNGVVLWNEHHESILHQVKLKPAEGKLVIEKEGYYSVYSKIHFQDDKITCTHSVLRTTDRYRSEILLLQSSRFHPKLQRQRVTDNSFLSGMFHLYKGDAVFVRVKNCTIVLSNGAENYFGVFMV
ncbi:unnamed protein product [Leuciscus chuanchicus]